MPEAAWVRTVVVPPGLGPAVLAALEGTVGVRVLERTVVPVGVCYVIDDEAVDRGVASILPMVGFADRDGRWALDQHIRATLTIGRQPPTSLVRISGA